MDALSIIDSGPQTVAPIKANSNSEQSFNRVLEQKQQIQQDKPIASSDNKPEASPDVINPESKSNEVATKTDPQPEEAATSTQETGIQSTITDLIAVLSEEETANAEDTDAVETLLTNLLQQLESTEDLEQQVVAGIDLSHVTEQLETLNSDVDRDEFLTQFVVQVQEQLSNQRQGENTVGLLTEMVAATPQNQTPVIVENHAQVRQALQKAFDSVISPQPVVSENSTEEAIATLPGATADTVDPRFAGLVKPRADQTVQLLRSAQEHLSSKQENQPFKLQSAEAVTTETKTALDVGTAQLASGNNLSLENLVQQSQQNFNAQGQSQVQGLETNKLMPQTPVVQLASGQQVPESQVIDQVVTHLSGSVNGDTGRMVLRLQPAELGSLKLELIVEGDRIKANLHAQTHQVQEVLERNLPQLRNALAEQGLKIDQFQVNVDQQQQDGQFENLSQQQQNNGSEGQKGWQQPLDSEELNIPLAQLMQNAGGGINLHV
ncbi:hook-length control protein FliK [Desulfuromusa kysingii]|uniref:Hook-length control protein FliK n=1 Tax=Desulfuromusa kysingii TaxID=37625 RepID=A0A1H3VHD8_9BACT|nr:flagellar hook-length control protein FliK [Desulfuromusa kysingii]SDZ74150.1 hook-length control protein FliK [Desulfuromusa kysingii]